MHIMQTFADLLDQTMATLDSAEADLDGPAIRRGLLLAAHAGLTVDRRAETTSQWDLYAMAVGDALVVLQSDLSEELLLSADVPDAGKDDLRLRALVRSLVGHLANRYATAAAGFDGGTDSTATRRSVWAKVAHRLDDAAAQLPCVP